MIKSSEDHRVQTVLTAPVVAPQRTTGLVW